MRSVSRVLMTADAVGGVWTYAAQLSEALSQRGIEVIVATMGPEPDEAQRRLLGKRVRLEVSRYPLEWMDGAARDAGRASAWLLELETCYAPDIVHFNGYGHGALPTRAPRIIVAHSCVGSWFRAVKGEELPAGYAPYRRQLLAGINGAHALVAPSRAMLADLEAAYDVSLAERAWVIANGIALEACVPQPKDRLITAVGRTWDEAKNIAALCSIADKLDWPVSIAGAASHDGNAGHVSGQVRFLGALARDAVLDLLGRAAILVHPARYEPFGLVPLEAAASGCALVLGDIPSLREIWGEAAIYVPPDDARALLATLQRVIRDSDLRHALSQRARAHAQQYSLTAMVDQYLALYARALGGQDKEISCTSSSSRTRSYPTGITAMPISCAASSPSSSRVGTLSAVTNRVKPGA